MDEVLVALGLILAIEGGAYALFPEGMKRLLALALAMPAPQLRQVGLGMAIVGVLLIWLVRR